MQKWIIIAVVIVVFLIGVMEIARRSNKSESTAAEVGETGSGAAVVEHLKGRSWEKPEDPNVGGSESQEFDQAERILDSREQSLEDAKKSTRVIINAVKNN